MRVVKQVVSPLASITSYFKNGIVGKNIGDSIDTISGATVSSSAVITGIEEATAHYEDNFK